MARTVHHVDDHAKLAAKGTEVDEAHTAGLDQSPLRGRLCNQRMVSGRYTDKSLTHATSTIVNPLRGKIAPANPHFPASYLNTSFCAPESIFGHPH